MTLDELIDNLLIKIVKAIFYGAKAILTTSWYIIFSYGCWSVGWVLCRLATLGRFPQERFREVDDSPFFVGICVELLGFGFLLLLFYSLSPLVE
jgi:hypothetical protein